MKKKRAAAVAAAAVTAAGMAVGGAFSSPRDLLQPDDGPVPAPITEMLVPAWAEVPGGAAAGEPGEDGPEEEGEELPGRFSPAARFRAWVLKLPLAVRAAAGVPLWCLGWLALTVLSGLWNALLSPALGTVLGWAVLALALVGAFLLSVKAALPDVPIKKLVNRRNLLCLLLGTAAIALLDAALPLFFQDYERGRALFRAVCTAGLWCAVTAVALRRERRAETPAEPEPEDAETEEETPEQAQERALRFVRELVDEVSPKKWAG